MSLHALHDPPSPQLAHALAEFDARFSYPLGPGRSFQISHGEDYPRFFRAMGEARCFVAEKQGVVTGALGLALRTLCLPDGSSKSAAYVGDLKIDPQRNAFVLLRLLLAADAWARPRVSAAFGVVMDGTRISPTAYTGRAGIVGFKSIAKILVLRLPAGTAHRNDFSIVSAVEGEASYQLLSRGRYFATGGNPAERSEIAPFWLVHPQGLACGRLEDTRRAKRLIDSDGAEMQSAHLACFAWNTPQAAADLIHAARQHAARLGFPALFVAVAERDFDSLNPCLGTIDKVVAPATIYGVGLPAGAEWNINSSEI